MKKIPVLLISLVLLFSLSSCAVVERGGENSADTVTIRNAEIYDGYAVLPLCDTIAAMGFQLTWVDGNRATFVCNDTEYEISISEKTLTKRGESDNYLICAPGNDHFVCEVENGVLTVDDLTLQCLFQTFLEYPVSISIDRNDNVVTIVKQ